MWMISWWLQMLRRQTHSWMQFKLFGNVHLRKPPQLTKRWSSAAMRFKPYQVVDWSWVNRVSFRSSSTNTMWQVRKNTAAPKISNPPDEDYDIQTLRTAQGLTGELQWIQSRTRPDLCYIVGCMSRWLIENQDLLSAWLSIPFVTSRRPKTTGSIMNQQRRMIGVKIKSCIDREQWINWKSMWHQFRAWTRTIKECSRSAHRTSRICNHVDQWKAAFHCCFHWGSRTSRVFRGTPGGRKCWISIGRVGHGFALHPVRRLPWRHCPWRLRTAARGARGIYAFGRIDCVKPWGIAMSHMKKMKAPSGLRDI